MILLQAASASAGADQTVQIAASQMEYIGNMLVGMTLCLAALLGVCIFLLAGISVRAST